MQLEQGVPATARSFESFPDPTWSVGGDGRLVAWNRAAEDVFGLTLAEVAGRTPLDVLGDAAAAAGPVALRDAHGRPVHGSVVLWVQDGLRHASLRVSTGDAGAIGRAVLAELLEHVSDAVLTVDADGIVRSANGGVEKLYGVPAVEAVGRPARALTRDDGTDDVLRAVARALRAGEPWRGVEGEVTTLAGRTVLVETSATALSDPHGGYAGAVLVSRDVTPVRELEQSLRAATRALRDRAAAVARASHRDALTGVAARSLLQERIGAVLSAATDGDDPVWVLAADLDGFRAVNDSYGLAAGDAVLISFAAHLRSALPPTATAGRLGADEFAVVLPGLAEDEVQRVARTVGAWTPPFPLPSRGRRADDPPVGVTVGVVRATSLECRSPFDTGVRSVLQRVEEAVAEGKRAAR
ncbi:GGDEF domain-containing protein [Kineococcus rhizosphaerae]|uniref:PAS domain S-box-containing protein/diguanylate cyclase (GGDEF)-like protein n=1 Tax=Kineococcus rhizosphaerae TaxID=559628 RepID=A0A2T0QYK7_9ACTN|nr:PAS domain-containing protein [Kineococcus rhizosphaerae]PRY11464.1 PAS domain S-box-containing protein/diguanylate cyclase (GGDEF)-like protein [Kineococcus rhizosphaerae]